MKKKMFYMAAFFLLLLGLLGPAIYHDKISPRDTQLSVGETVTPPVLENNSAKVSTPSIVTVDTGSNIQNPPEPVPVTKELPKGNNEEKSFVNEGVLVNLKVLGKNGEVLLEPARVQISKNKSRNATALDALAASGLAYEVSLRWPGLVESVAGQRNKGQSGWMYQVNGETPMAGADSKIIASGDRVIWWYSQSVDTPAPKW